jgi:multicomponent K+:H+ antiporter subunit F
MMFLTLLPWAIGLFVVAMLLTTWRLWRGPDLSDRILALDTLYINALALLVLVGVWQGQQFVFEVALLIGLLGFIGTVVLSRFVIKGDIVQ